MIDFASAARRPRVVRWAMVTPEVIDRVDVLYGPFSAAYPGNAVSAVADFVTRQPQRFEAHTLKPTFVLRGQLQTQPGPLWFKVRQGCEHATLDLGPGAGKRQPQHRLEGTGRAASGNAGHCQPCGAPPLTRLHHPPASPVCITLP